jgi:DNA-binding transcriptional MerR regulator
VQVDDREQPPSTEAIVEQAAAIRRRTTAFFTLAEVVARTGAKRRAVQLWADGGVIESTAETDRAGTGVHRVYDESQVQIAAILAALANNISMPIGELQQLA